MKKIIITIFALVSIAAAPSFAGFGDNTPFGSDQESTETPVEIEEEKTTNDFDSDDKFGKESFSKGGENEQIMGPPPPRIPLDGGASLLLLGGIGLGIKKLFGKKK